MRGEKQFLDKFKPTMETSNKTEGPQTEAEEAVGC